MKGQITIYIILGIVVALIAGIAFYIQQQRITAPPAFQPVNALVQGCLENAIYQNSLRAQGLAGKNSLQTGFGRIVYGVLQNRYALPDRSEVEAGISARIAVDINSCANFSSLQGFAVEAGNISVGVSVSQARITAKLLWPLRISRGKTEVLLRDWSAETASDLGLLHETASRIAHDITAHPDNVDLSFLSSLPIESAVIPYDAENFVVALKSRKLLRGSEQLFAFAVNVVHNRAPVLSVPGILRLKDGQRTTIQASANDPEGSAVSFEDDTSLFDINPETGIAIFTPEVPGRYDIRIRAYDEKGLYDEELMVVVVE